MLRIIRRVPLSVSRRGRAVSTILLRLLLAIRSIVVVLHIRVVWLLLLLRRVALEVLRDTRGVHDRAAGRGRSTGTSRDGTVL